MDLKDVPHKGGRILAADILTAAVSAPAAEEGPREEVKRMNGMRKAIARNMQNSHMTSPTVTFNLGCEVPSLPGSARGSRPMTSRSATRTSWSSSWPWRSGSSRCSTASWTGSI